MNYFYLPVQTSSKFESEELVYRGERVTWYRPTTLNSLLDLKAKYCDAKLVIGNTEIGELFVYL